MRFAFLSWYSCWLGHFFVAGETRLPYIEPTRSKILHTGEDVISRRTMIAGSVATVAAAYSCSLEAFGANPSSSKTRKFTMDLRGSSIGLEGDQRKMIDLAAQHGFESVGADAWFIGGLSDDEIAKLKSDVSDKGLVWGSAGLPVEFRKDDAKFQEGLSGLAKRAAALQKAGVTRMGTWIIPCHDELTYVQNFKQHATRLRECAKILKDNGLRFGLEYVGPQTLRNSMRYPFLHTMKETRELNAEIGVDNMGLIMDSWHWYTAGETEADLATLTNQEIVACDLNDAPKGKTVNEQMDLERELPAATGVIDVKTFLNGLVAVGYDGPVRAEPFNKVLNAMNNDEACKSTHAAIKSAFDLIG